MMGRWFAGFAILFLTAACFCQEVNGRIQELYVQAQSQEKGGQLDQAIATYTEIVKLDPKLAAAQNNLGRLYYQQGRLEEAGKALKRACELDAKLEPPRALLGFALFQMGDFEGARRELRAAAQLNPKDANARLFLARSLVELKDLKGALKLLDQLQQEDPKNAEVLYTLGTLYSSLAEKTIGSIQAADPNSYLIEVLLGSYSEVKQVYKDAAEHYKRAIDRAPDVPDSYYRYAHALWLLGDSQSAVTQYKKALELNPYDYRAAWEEARAVLADNPEEAVKFASQALKLKPDIAEALTIRARALLAMQRPEDAVKDLRIAIALSPDDPSSHFQLARAYRQLGLTQEAQNENAAYERLDQASRAAKEQLAASPQ
jgi:tetratricopeptide (TPR) repeat protein